MWNGIASKYRIHVPVESDIKMCAANQPCSGFTEIRSVARYDLFFPLISHTNATSNIH